MVCGFIWVARYLKSSEKGKEWSVKSYGMGFEADGSEEVLAMQRLEELAYEDDVARGNWWAVQRLASTTTSTF